VEFKPEPFHFQLPQDWVNAYLVAMSDGYGKISDEVADRLYDYNEADQILAQRFPDFARVYLPEALHREHASEVPRSPEGRVRYADIAHHQALWDAIGDYYDQQATSEERQELELIDLDCVGLRQVVREEPDQVCVHGKSGAQLLADSHKTLSWMRQARYMPHEDELGLEEYLRQYVMAELFTEAMISEMFDAARPTDTLPARLHAFGESLGPVGDDFSVALMKILRR
jgi:hypothetical protein